MTAAEKILKKALVGSSLDSRRWNAIQAGLRDRAFFSATVQSRRILRAARDMVAQHASGGLSASEIRRDLRYVLRSEGVPEDPERAAAVTNLYSKARLDLIVKTNVEQARGFVRHLEANTPGGFSAFPAQELVRVRERRERRDWINRWKDHGGHFYDGGRMIALKDDPIWTAISAFGNPFPPFDFNSGMGVRGVGKAEAIRLGIITAEGIREKSEKLMRSPAPGFNSSLKTEVDADEARDLKESFGDQITVKGGFAEWTEYTGMTPSRLPGPDGSLVSVPTSATEDVPPELLPLGASVLRTGTLEAFTGETLAADIRDGILKGITIS